LRSKPKSIFLRHRCAPDRTSYANKFDNRGSQVPSGTDVSPGANLGSKSILLCMNHVVDNGCGDNGTPKRNADEHCETRHLHKSSRHSSLEESCLGRAVGRHWQSWPCESSGQRSQPSLELVRRGSRIRLDHMFVFLDRHAARFDRPPQLFQPPRQVPLPNLPSTA